MAIFAACVLVQPADGQAPPRPSQGWSGLGWVNGPRVARADDSQPKQLKSYPVVFVIRGCSPAELAGFEFGDELVSVDGRDGRLLPLFPGGPSAPGTVHEVTVRRGERLLELTLTLAEPPAEDEDPSDRCKKLRNEPPSTAGLASSSVARRGARRSANRRAVVRNDAPIAIAFRPKPK